MELTFTVPEGDGRKVESVLRHDLHLSAAMVRRLKHDVRGIAVDGKPAYTNRVLQSGEVLKVDILCCEEPCDVVPESGEISVLYENEGLVAVNKPSGILVHPSRARYTGTLANFVAGYLAEATGSGACHAVNRLDRDTSGVVLFAKNSHMKALAAKALLSGDSVKEYTAVVFGVMSPEKGTINAPIKRLREGDMIRGVAEDGQRAVTHYETMCSGTVSGIPLSVAKVILETGRTHQIRVHFTHMGHPLVGDTLYKNEECEVASKRLGARAQMLHAERLSFTEPLRGEYMTITAADPREDVASIMEQLNFGVDRS